MHQLRRCQPWLGTYVTLDLASAVISREDLMHWSTQCFNRIGEVHQRMSFQSPDSELSQLNRAAPHEWLPISAALCFVLSAAIALSQLSDGYFDVCYRRGKAGVSDEAQNARWCDLELDEKNRRLRLQRRACIDLSGIAKGYAVDHATQLFPPEIDYTLNAGGDLKMSQWKGRAIAIRLPNGQQQPDVLMQNAALASSSDEFACATINPFVPSTACSDTISASCFSVWSEQCMWADGLTKVLRLHPNPKPILQRFGAIGQIFSAPGMERMTHAAG